MITVTLIKFLKVIREVVHFMFICNGYFCSARKSTLLAGQSLNLCEPFIVLETRDYAEKDKSQGTLLTVE